MLGEMRGVLLQCRASASFSCCSCKDKTFSYSSYCKGEFILYLIIRDCYIGFSQENLRMVTSTTGILYFFEFTVFDVFGSIKNAVREGNLDQKEQNTMGGWL